MDNLKFIGISHTLTQKLFTDKKDLLNKSGDKNTIYDYQKQYYLNENDIPSENNIYKSNDNLESVKDNSKNKENNLEINSKVK